jgi:aspartate 1-decarboxylase
MPNPVCEEGDVTVLWNQAVHTDREVTANRPDIIIKNNKEKTCTQMWQYQQTKTLCKRKRKRG